MKTKIDLCAPLRVAISSRNFIESGKGDQASSKSAQANLKVIKPQANPLKQTSKVIKPRTNPLKHPKK
ncbi:hypothetical protein [Sporosarcina aquimarina]|uniref:hypothetical protein n=1 Tax=Sporosarcina aquimarina TaxID=114975 RepID=UPI002040EC24|nr:hypothetical protein [Sporosarcina aquimarina]